MVKRNVFGGGNAIRALWDAVRTSLWFLPALMSIAAPLLVIGAMAVDSWLGQGEDQQFPWFIYVSKPAQAREFLSTILTSMITMASLVFSITMVVLTLAASQFGPRLIRNFMGRRVTQFVLGTYVMTILYSLLLLASVPEGEESQAFLSVTIAIVLTVVSVCLLVLFIHTLARSIMSETLIEAVGRELDQGIHDLRPLGHEDDPEAALPDDFEERAEISGLERFGYVQAIEFERIVEAARAADALVGIYLRAGDYAIDGSRAFGIYPKERVSPELEREIRSAITLGMERTPVQDLEFSIRHLVEIAVRALSPGINDPYSAVAVVHRLSGAWSRLVDKSMPPGVFHDEEGEMRVICPRPTYAILLNASFSQIRQSGAEKPLVLIHLLQAMGKVSRCARTDEQREALRAQVEAVLEDARRAIPNSADLRDVEEQGRRALAELKGCAEDQPRARRSAHQT